jgi:hypothetical protein
MTNLSKFLLLGALFLIGLQVKSQELLDRTIEVTLTSGTAEQLLLHLEEKSGIVFSYSNQVCLPRRVILKKTKAPVKYFLDQIFAACHVEYQVRMNKILIIPQKLTDLIFSIKGYVQDSISGESLIGANVFDLFGNKGVSTNEFGYFSITLNGGDVYLGSSYIGYNMGYQPFRLSKDTLIVFKLTPMPALDEVPVLGTMVSGDIQSSRTGTIDIPVSQIVNVPSFMGEADVVKTIQLFPGVQSGNEGFSGLYVRGGGADQNLVLLDDVPVYHMEHLLGFFSVFNPDAINKITLIKGGFPAQYGGRLSSVLDIRTYEGNNQKLKGSVGIGLLSSKLSLDGPLWNKNTTFSVSLRRTYYDLMAAIFQNSENSSGSYYFYDINAKVNHTFSPKSRLYLSFYNGKDDVESHYNFKDITKSLLDDDYDYKDTKLSDKTSTGWGNVVCAGRWNYIFNDKVFANITTSFSNYRFYNDQGQNYYVNDAWSNVNTHYYSGIMDFGAKIDLDYYATSGNHFKAGASYTRHQFYPGIDVVQTELSNSEKRDTTYGGKIIYGHEMHAYLQDDIVISPTLKFNTGMHLSMFYTGSKFYTTFEPRLTGRLLVSPSVSIKASYSTMTQYMHLLSTASLSMPTDLWLPVTDEIKPMNAWQTSLSAEWQIMPDFNLTGEVYYKKTNNLLDYKNNQSFFDTNTDWTGKLTSGTSTSYGLEVLLHRKFGSWSGWAGYTLSKSDNQFDEINQGQPFRSNNDRRHDGSLFLSYLFNDHVDASLTWSVGSGKPVTLADEKYYAPQLPTGNSNAVTYSESYSKRNGYTMPAFHRMDVGVNFKKENRWGERIWSVGVMNVYGRQNPFFLFYSDAVNETTGETTRSLKQFSLFPFPLPYFRYSLKF